MIREERMRRLQSRVPGNSQRRDRAGRFHCRAFFSLGLAAFAVQNETSGDFLGP